MHEAVSNRAASLFLTESERKTTTVPRSRNGTELSSKEQKKKGHEKNIFE